MFNPTSDELHIAMRILLRPFSRSLWISSLVAVLVAVWVIAVTWQSPTAVTAVEPVRAPAQVGEHIAKKLSPGPSLVPTKHVKTAARADFVPPPTTAPDELISASREAAAEGDRVASRVLADALHTCFFADRGDDDALKDRIARQVVAQERLSAHLNVPMVSTDDPQAIFSAWRATRDACAQVPAADAKTWLGNMENAAQAGDDRARILYARYALREFETQESRIENIDEYDRRKATAFGFLNDSLAEGYCGDEMINLLQTMSPNPTTKYVYGSVMMQMADVAFAAKGTRSAAEIAAQETGRRMVAKIMVAPVPEDQIEAAENAARNIYEAYCAG